MTNIRTVSDTKQAFYTYHTRPINSIYRRVVEELMVEMHLLSVNIDYSYNPIYGLGVVTIYNRFMQGYQPDWDKTPIFESLIKALGEEPPRYETDAKTLEDIAINLSSKELISYVTQKTSANNLLTQTLNQITQNPKFKYSRLFTVGLFTLLELTDSAIINNESLRNEAISSIAEGLKIAPDKIQKDIDLYRSNLEKMYQAQQLIQETIEAERKKRN